MGRYPRTVRDARLKCIDCNAPVIRTIEEEYACVNCGESPIRSRESGGIESASGAARSAATDD